MAIIIIKNSINNDQLNNYSQNFLQGTSVSVEDSIGLLISAVYLQPRYTVQQEKLEDFYQTTSLKNVIPKLKLL
jgi:hypothetical protein